MASLSLFGTEFHLSLGTKALPDATVNLGQNSNKIAIHEKKGDFTEREIAFFAFFRKSKEFESEF